MKNTNTTPPTLAAIDLGSNSFHMIVATLQDEQLQLLDRLREPVRLAEGLTTRHALAKEVSQRALECLQRFGQRIRDLDSDNIRAVGTNTLRMVSSNNDFLDQAQQALGQPIEIISGIEEARLVYLGATHSLPETEGNQLIVDIGGGSTELVIGNKTRPLQLESLYMGCVNMSQRFFENGTITRSGMKKAVMAARLELLPSSQAYRRQGWSMAAGSSGTIRAIYNVVKEAGWSDNGITAESLKTLRKQLIDVGHINNLDFSSVSGSRKPVFAGGVAIISAIFSALKINHMLYSPGALREGLLYDQLGRICHNDIRDNTQKALATRYQVDTMQAARVETTAINMLEQVAKDWSLRKKDARQWLHWSSMVHEIGRVIAHAQHHKHGAYLIEHSDLPGFSQRDQQFLSVLLLCSRRKLHLSVMDSLPTSMHQPATRLCILLRLSILLHRSRSDDLIPPIKTSANNETIHVCFPENWLQDNPLTQADLELEKKYLKQAGLKLEYE